MIKKILLCIGCVFLLLITTGSPVYAQDVEPDCTADIYPAVCENVEDENISPIYQDKKYKPLWDKIETNNPWVWAICSLGWGVSSFLGFVADSLFNVSKEVFTIMETFTKSEEVQAVYDKVYLICMSMLAVVIAVIGLQAILGNNKVIKQSLKQFLLVLLFFLSVSMIFDNTISFIAAVRDEIYPEDMKISTIIMRQHIIDLHWYKTQLGAGNTEDQTAQEAENAANRPNQNIYNNLTDEELAYFNPNAPARHSEEIATNTGPINQEIVEESSIAGTWFNRLVEGYDSDTGSLLIKKYSAADNGVFNTGFGKTFINRFKVNYPLLIISLVVVDIVLFFFVFKQAEILWEFATKKILSPAFAVVSFFKPGLLGQFIISIFMAAGSLIVIFLMTYFFIIFLSYLGTIAISGLGLIILIIVVGKQVLTGTKTARELTGDSGGVATGSGMVAAFLGAKAVGTVAKTGANAIKGGAKAGIGLGASVAGHNAGKGLANNPNGDYFDPETGMFAGMKMNENTNSQFKNALANKVNNSDVMQRYNQNAEKAYYDRNPGLKEAMEKGQANQARFEGKRDAMIMDSAFKSTYGNDIISNKVADKAMALQTDSQFKNAYSEAIIDNKVTDKAINLAAHNDFRNAYPDDIVNSRAEDMHINALAATQYENSKLNNLKQATGSEHAPGAEVDMKLNDWLNQQKDK